MKKKNPLIILALVSALCTAPALSACGKGASGDLKSISLGDQPSLVEQYIGKPDRISDNENGMTYFYEGENTLTEVNFVQSTEGYVVDSVLYNANTAQTWEQKDRGGSTVGLKFDGETTYRDILGMEVEDYQATITLSDGSYRLYHLEELPEEYEMSGNLVNWTWTDEYGKHEDVATRLTIQNGLPMDCNVYAHMNGEEREVTLTIDEGVAVIDAHAFRECSQLTKVVIPNSMAQIYYRAFEGCENLNAVEIKDLARWCSIDFLAYNANPLYYAKNLYLNGKLVEGELKLPDTLTSISKNSLRNCANVTKLVIPSRLTRIGDYSLIGFEDLEHIEVEAGNVNYKSENDCLIDTRLNTVIVGSGTDVTIPADITKVDTAAFYNNGNIQKLTIPGTVKQIGDSAFYGCRNLSEIEIASRGEGFDGRLAFGAMSFGECDALETVTIPRNVSLGKGTFYLCKGLSNVTLPEGIADLSPNLHFQEDDQSLDKADKYGFFEGCTSLVSITLPASIRTIGVRTFANCTSLETVVYQQVTESTSIAIERSAFEGCTSLTSLPLPAAATNRTVNALGDAVFAGCTGLVSVTIPAEVKSIGKEAFKGCTNLQTVTYVPTEFSNTNFTLGDSAFEDCTSLTALPLPNNAVDNKSVKELPAYAFAGCTGLVNITIPGDVTMLGEGVFKDCTSLTTVNYEPSSTDGLALEASAFENCTSLTALPLFGLKDVVITSVESSVFAGCTSLENAVLPADVTIIKENAFAGCTGLKSISILAKEFSEVEVGAFQGCDALTTVNFAGTAEEWQAVMNKRIVDETVMDALDKGVNVTYNYQG